MSSSAAIVRERAASPRVAREERARHHRVIQRLLREADARGERCSCDIHPEMSFDDLVSLGGGCRDPFECCPVLARIRRKVERSRRAVAR